jgi:hypothetical protein
MFHKTRNQATDLVVQAQYLLDERRRKIWIPFLESKAAELEERIREKEYTEEPCPSEA